MFLRKANFTISHSPREFLYRISIDKNTQTVRSSEVGRFWPNLEHYKKGLKMATERDLDRAQAIHNYGRNCYFCAAGPLERRALFLKPLGPNNTNVPLCKTCCHAVDTGMSLRPILLAHLKRGRALEAVASLRLTEYGWATPRRPEHLLSHED